MNVIWHDYEFVKLKDSAVAIAEHRVEKQFGCAFIAEERLSLCGCCRDKEYALGKIHATAAKASRSANCYHPAGSRVLPRCC